MQTYSQVITQKQANLKKFMLENKPKESTSIIMYDNIIKLCETKPEELIVIIKTSLKDTLPNVWIENKIIELEIKEDISKQKNKIIDYLICFKDLIKDL